MVQVVKQQTSRVKKYRALNIALKGKKLSIINHEPNQSINQSYSLSAW